MMITGFFTFFLLFPPFFYWLCSQLDFNPFRVGVIQFLLLALFAFSFIGVLPLFLGVDEYRASLGATDKVQLSFIMICSAYSMVMVLLGAVLMRNILRSKTHQAILVNDFDENYSEFVWMIVLVLLSAVVFYLYALEIERFAILSVMAEGSEKAMILRSEMGNNFPGKLHRYSFFMNDLINIMTFSFFSMWLAFKKNRYFVLFFIVFLFSSFTSLMAVEKGPFMWLIIGLFITYSIVRCNCKYPIKKLFVVFFLLLVILVSMYIFFMGSDSIASAMKSLVSRRFAGSIQPVYQYLSFFPYEHDFLYGRSFPNPGGIFPFEPYLLTVEVANWVFPQLYEKGVVSSMPTVFWGEAYANFGYLGIAIIPFLMGMLVYCSEVLFLKWGSGALRVGFFVWMMLHYKNLSVTGFSGFLLDVKIILMFFLCFSLLKTANYIKAFYKMDK